MSEVKILNKKDLEEIRDIAIDLIKESKYDKPVILEAHLKALEVYLRRNNIKAGFHVK